MSYKKWLIIAVILFGSGLVAGLVTPADEAGFAAEDIAALEELAGFLATLPPIAVFAIIFIKNASAVLLSFAFSPILCLVPVLALTMNGWLIGFISAAVVREVSLGYLLTGILPHGILEIPALIIGEAAALSFGSMVILALFQKKRRSLLLPGLRRNLRYLLIALALLLPAAIIEAYLTPWLLGLY